MKKAYRILRDRRRLTLQLTRDAVAAGDDAEPKAVETYSFVDPEVLARHLYPSYLPQVSGDGYAWDCMLNGHRIATITVDGVTPVGRQVTFLASNRVHFRYRSRDR